MANDCNKFNYKFIFLIKNAALATAVIGLHFVLSARCVATFFLNFPGTVLTL